MDTKKKEQSAYYSRLEEITRGNGGEIVFPEPLAAKMENGREIKITRLSLEICGDKEERLFINTAEKIGYFFIVTLAALQEESREELLRASEIYARKGANKKKETLKG